MFYKYKVTWYNSYEDEEMTEKGLVYAKSYSSAADNVVKDYGEDDIVDVYLYQIYNEDDGTCISEDELKSVFKEDE